MATLSLMLTPSELERLRAEAMIDERTMYRLATKQAVRGDVKRRVERAAKRLRIDLPADFLAA